MSTPAETAARSPVAEYWRKVRIAGAVGLLLVAHFALANAAAWNKCGMFDETSHIASGNAAWRTGDFRIIPLAIFQQRWMTLPLEWMHVRAPSTDQTLWQRADNWAYGKQLLYELGNNGTDILRNCRMMNSLASVVLGGLVFWWSQRLFGTIAGFIALTLYAFNPTVLGHAAAATPDMFSALAFTGCALSLLAVLNRLTPIRLLVSSLVWGLALTSKFSSLLLLPIAGLMIAVRLWSGEPLRVSRRIASPNEATFEVVGRGRQLPYYALVAAVHFVGAVLVIWAMYDFRFDTFRDVGEIPPQPYLGTFDQMAASAGGYEPLVRWMHRFRLLPEPYLYSFAEAVRTTGSRVSYLDGQFSIYGTPAFFPLAFLYKTPPGFFVVLFSAFAAHVALRRTQLADHKSARTLLWNGFYATYPLWLILLVYGYTSISGPLNIGIRHILPMFPAAFILCGAAGDWFTRLSKSRSTGRRAMQVVMSVGLATYIFDVAAAYPNYVAYFSWPAGGVDRGHEHLVDSSLDWGQELPALKEWLHEQDFFLSRKKTPLYLSYFGTTLPDVVELSHMPLPCFFPVGKADPSIRRPVLTELQPGVYCISATMLQSLYTAPFSGPWLASYEKRYRELISEMAKLDETVGDAKARAAVLKDPGIESWTATLHEFRQARLARLCAYLRRQTPIKVVNGAILVYRLTADDLDHALRLEMPTVPDPATLEEPIRY